MVCFKRLNFYLSVIIVVNFGYRIRLRSRCNCFKICCNHNDFIILSSRVHDPQLNLNQLAFEHKLPAALYHYSRSVKNQCFFRINKMGITTFPLRRKNVSSILRGSKKPRLLENRKEKALLEDSCLKISWNVKLWPNEILPHSFRIVNEHLDTNFSNLRIHPVTVVFIWL